MRDQTIKNPEESLRYVYIHKIQETQQDSRLGPNRNAPAAQRTTPPRTGEHVHAMFPMS